MRHTFILLALSLAVTAVPGMGTADTTKARMQVTLVSTQGDVYEGSRLGVIAHNAPARSKVTFEIKAGPKWRYGGTRRADAFGGARWWTIVPLGESSTHVRVRAEGVTSKPLRVRVKASDGLVHGDPTQLSRRGILKSPVTSDAPGPRTPTSPSDELVDRLHAWDPTTRETQNIGNVSAFGDYLSRPDRNSFEELLSQFPGVVLRSRVNFGEVSAAVNAASLVARQREGTVGFAVVDIDTARTWTNEEADTVKRSASIVKVAMAAYMLEKSDIEVSPALWEKLRLLITESNDVLMYELFNPRSREVIDYLRNYDHRVQYSSVWGWTGVTARGQARFLAALASDSGMERSYSEELIGLKRNVVPAQRWGWSDAFPAEVAEQLPVKNGWFVWNNGTATINCLALLPYHGQEERLAAAILTSYPARLGLDYGRNTCRQVAAAFVSSLAATP